MHKVEIIKPDVLVYDIVDQSAIITPEFCVVIDFTAENQITVIDQLDFTNLKNMKRKLVHIEFGLSHLDDLLRRVNEVQSAQSGFQPSHVFDAISVAHYLITGEIYNVDLSDGYRCHRAIDIAGGIIFAGLIVFGAVKNGAKLLKLAKEVSSGTEVVKDLVLTGCAIFAATRTPKSDTSTQNIIDDMLVDESPSIAQMEEERKRRNNLSPSEKRRDTIIRKKTKAESRAGAEKNIVRGVAYGLANILVSMPVTDVIGFVTSRCDSINVDVIREGIDNFEAQKAELV